MAPADFFSLRLVTAAAVGVTDACDGFPLDSDVLDRVGRTVRVIEEELLPRSDWLFILKYKKYIYINKSSRY